MKIDDEGNTYLATCLDTFHRPDYKGVWLVEKISSQGNYMAYVEAINYNGFVDITA